MEMSRREREKKKSWRVEKRGSPMRDIVSPASCTPSKTDRKKRMMMLLIAFHRFIFLFIQNKFKEFLHLKNIS